MVDQVSALNDRGIPAALLSSANTEQENTEVLQRLVGRKKNVTKRSEARSCVDTDAAALKPIKLVYCTPELIETTRFRAILTELFRKGKLSLFAIDEAHCLSTWGHDFRPAYRKLNWVRASMPSVPCMACTATVGFIYSLFLLLSSPSSPMFNICKPSNLSTGDTESNF
mmetsp:Transcript_44594/g.135991  ORF Transcript_44594/g.135991 Transcript_44594/m.135991 type:complete len:169 (-) Transcript_44594:1412-1918(-)